MLTRKPRDPARVACETSASQIDTLGYRDSSSPAMLRKTSGGVPSRVMKERLFGTNLAWEQRLCSPGDRHAHANIPGFNQRDPCTDRLILDGAERSTTVQSPGSDATLRRDDPARADRTFGARES